MLGHVIFLRGIRDAEQCQRRGRYREAARRYLAAARSPHQEERFKAWMGAIECYRSLGWFRKAVPLIQRALRLSSILSPVHQAEVLAARGLVARGLEQFVDAIRWLKKAKSVYRSLSDIQGEAYSEWGLGGCERFRGRPREAVKQFIQAQRKFLRARDRHGWAYATFGLAGAMRVLGKIQPSLRAYQAAGKACRRSRDTFGTAYGLCGMAHALRKLERWKEAERCYRRSGVLYRRMGDLSSVGYTAWGCGRLAATRGETVKARREYRLALRDFRTAQDTRGVALARWGLAMLEGSPRHMERALRWAKNHGVVPSVLKAY